MKITQKVIGMIMLTFICLTVFSAVTFGDTSGTTRIKDIARLQGVRSNQLNGMGLVIGLNGTGDSSKTNAQMVVNVLAKWGIIVAANDLKTKNVAAVVVTANLPPYLHQGDTLDVQVSSIGDAKSLQGGILLQAPMTGADGKVYTIAQGPVYVGANATATKGAAVPKDITTVGIVVQGAIVEREVPIQLDYNGRIRWALINPDFTTASRLAQTINDNIAEGSARAVDMGLVEVLIPSEKSTDPVGFIAEIESLPVTPDGIAKVIINERNGTIVVGDKVKIAPVAVTQRNITVKVNAVTNPTVQNTTVNDSTIKDNTAIDNAVKDNTVADNTAKDNAVTDSSQPVATNGSTPVAQNTTANADQDSGRMIVLPGGSTIGSIVRALNAVGTTPQDIIAIIVAIKEAGALYAKLEFQ
jgi:flagellar P-ring protein precursor FlgI